MLKFADNSKIKEGEQMHSKQQSETAIIFHGWKFVREWDLKASPSEKFSKSCPFFKIASISHYSQ